MVHNRATSPRSLDNSIPAPGATRWGKGFLCASGTVLFPGLGHLIAGRNRRAAVWLIVLLLMTAAVFASLITPTPISVLFVLVTVYVLLLTALFVDAFFVGRNSPRPMLSSPSNRYIMGIVLLLFGLALNRVLRRPAVWAIHSFGTDAYSISTHAMQPTLQPGDRILTHRVEDLRRWDLVVFHPPGRKDIFTQRIVGLPGEKVEIVSGQIRINDARVTLPVGVGPYGPDPISPPKTGCLGHPIRLGASEYYVLGDNSPLAYDSRLWTVAEPGHQLGAVPTDSIQGRVTAIYFPLRRIHQFK